MNPITGRHIEAVRSPSTPGQLVGVHGTPRGTAVGGLHRAAHIGSVTEIRILFGYAQGQGIFGPVRPESLGDPSIVNVCSRARRFLPYQRPCMSFVRCLRDAHPSLSVEL